MTLDLLGNPFQGTAWYWLEDSYHTATTSTATLPISCKIQNIRIDTGDRHKVLKDIGSPTSGRVRMVAFTQYIPPRSPRVSMVVATPFTSVRKL